MYRIAGKAEIKMTPNYRSLFFPLTIGSDKETSSGELQVAGQVLTVGKYIHLTSRLVLDTQLDCLIVLLPETSKTNEAITSP